jgi:hypothetical protein
LKIGKIGPRLFLNLEKYKKGPYSIFTWQERSFLINFGKVTSLVLGNSEVTTKVLGLLTLKTKRIQNIYQIPNPKQTQAWSNSYPKPKTIKAQSLKYKTWALTL